MKKVISFIVFSVIFSKIIACHCAEHHRKFPLGTIGDTLLIFETHLNRSDYIDRKNPGQQIPDPYWFGDIELSYYSLQGVKYYSKHLADITIYPNMDYVAILTDFLQKEISNLEKNNNFVIAKPIDIVSCEFQRKCNELEIIENPEKEKISIKLNTKLIEILDLKDSFSPLYQLYFYNHFIYKAVKDKLFISSFRQYEINNKKLYIVHLASGSPSENSNLPVYPDQPKIKRPEYFQRFLNLKQSIYEETVLSHGKGYDWFFYD